MIQMFDDALAHYQLTNRLPPATLTALGELREHLSDQSDPPIALGSIRHAFLEKGGNAGEVVVHFLTVLSPGEDLKYELRSALKTKLGVVFQKSRACQTADWKEGIEIILH